VSFVKALQIYEKMQNPNACAQMKYYMGLALAASGNTDKAMIQFNNALQTFTVIGARKWQEKAVLQIHKLPQEII
jgi:hypothetical protein